MQTIYCNSQLMEPNSDIFGKRTLLSRLSVTWQMSNVPFAIAPSYYHQTIYANKYFLFLNLSVAVSSEF